MRHAQFRQAPDMESVQEGLLLVCPDLEHMPRRSTQGSEPGHGTGRSNTNLHTCSGYQCLQGTRIRLPEEQER